MINAEITILPQLLDLMEFRSKEVSLEVGRHNERMSKFVGLILQKAHDIGLYKESLTQEYVDLSTKYTIFHDIGKIAVPDSILDATRTLTDVEFDIIKKHSEKGASLIEEIIPDGADDAGKQIAKEIAMSHHERWDGNGNPHHKKELEIPLCARAAAIADVFDALTSTRCYRKAISTDEAFNIIKEDSGSHFDPLLVQVFLDNKAEVEEICNS